MNKKGFTLIEIMATVLIIASIALISYPVLINVLKKNDEIDQDTFKKSAIIAAKTYFNLNKDKMVLDEDGYAIVSIEKLIDEDMLEKPEFSFENYAVKCNADYECEYVKTYIEYAIGDVITVNDEDYYVIKNSSFKQDYVVALKAEPLTVEEVNLYGGAGTDNNYVNKYTSESIGTAKNINSYGAMAYYSSETCGIVNSNIVTSNCKNDYTSSDVKSVIDAWIADVFVSNELVTLDGYSARLLTLDDLKLLGYELYVNSNGSVSFWTNTSKTPEWMNINSVYDTMELSLENPVNSRIHCIGEGGTFCGTGVMSINLVRPVINVKKTAIK